MPTTEPTINDALAEVLRTTRKAWTPDGVVRSENTGLIADSASKPDILVLEPHVSPVVIEAEVLPAYTAESEARGRLGRQLSSNGRLIFSAVALRYPEQLRDLSGLALRDALAETLDLEYVLITGRDGLGGIRWPSSGWLRGTASDLSLLVQSAALPPVLVDEAANHLIQGVEQAAGLLEELTTSHPAVGSRISEELKQEDVGQTRRMAMTILVNAFVFHENVARGPGDLGDVRTLGELAGQKGVLEQADLLTEWAKILEVNYWPIFDIARRIMEIIPRSRCQPIIDRLAATGNDLLSTGLMRSHDLMGVVFQKLIADRKFLAAYYTTPGSAALLTGLTIKLDATPGGGRWSDEEHLKSLKVADFACGTGTLLSTAYQRFGQLHELHGGDAEKLHPALMSDGIVGCDILPSAAHLTASMLAGVHPTITYDNSSILTVGYGRQPNGGVALGSLELMDDQRRLPIAAVTAKAATGTGETEQELWTKLQHVKFDLILMNPPFTRPTNHEGSHANVPNPMFAAFQSKPDEQREMSKATRRLFAGTAAHGNAGEASNFLVLVDKRLKPGGTMGLVMPLSLVSGNSWEASRKVLRDSYTDLRVISLAGATSAELSFSADTGMGECLVIGRKGKSDSGRAVFIILNERPAYPIIGSHAARQIDQSISDGNLRRLEDGPLGGTPITFGNDTIGYALDSPLPESGSWNIARIKDLALAQVAYQLASLGTLWLPGVFSDGAVKLQTTILERIGSIGPVHRDVNGKNSNGTIRGPFDIRPPSNGVSTYPALWAHEAARERTMAFDADREGILRKGKNAAEDSSIQSKSKHIWGTASHCHFNVDFQFNTQSTGMQFTERLTIGGRAWPSIKLHSPDLEKALVAWANTSLGILLHWWHANKQQAGRGTMGVTAMKSLPVLDVTCLTDDRLAAAVSIFEDLKDEHMLRIDQIDHDPVRHELDRRFVTEVLGAPPEICEPDGPLDLLRQKLASEPSITGGRQSA